MTGSSDPTLADRISAYLDGALAPVDRAALEALMARDPAVAAEVAAMRAVDSQLAGGFQHLLDRPVPLHLARAIDAASSPANLASGGTVGPVWSRLSGLWAVAASLVLLAVGATGGILATRAFGPAAEVVTARSGWLEDVAEYHRIYATQTRHLVEVPASETAHLETWVGDMTGVPFRAPDLTAKGLTFEGGRLLVAGGKPVGQLMYRDGSGKVVAVCFTARGDAGVEAGTTDFADRQLAGLDLVTWKTRDAAFVVIGDTGRSDLRAIAQAAAVAL